MFFQLLNLISSEEIYNPVTYSHVPYNFNASKYEHKIELLYGNQNYTCYYGKHHKDINMEPKEYLKKHLYGKRFDFSATQYWFWSFIPFSNLTQFRYVLANSQLAERAETFLIGYELNNQTYTVFDKGIYTNYSNGDICLVSKKPRHTNIEFLCNQAPSNSRFKLVVSETGYCNYLVQFYTKYACPFPGVKHQNITDMVCFVPELL